MHGVVAPVKKSEKPLTSDSRVLTRTTASLYSGSAPAPKTYIAIRRSFALSDVRRPVLVAPL